MKNTSLGDIAKKEFKSFSFSRCLHPFKLNIFYWSQCACSRNGYLLLYTAYFVHIPVLKIFLHLFISAAVANSNFSPQNNLFRSIFNGAKFTNVGFYDGHVMTYTRTQVVAGVSQTGDSDYPVVFQSSKK